MIFPATTVGDGASWEQVPLNASSRRVLPVRLKILSSLGCPKVPRGWQYKHGLLSP